LLSPLIRSGHIDAFGDSLEKVIALPQDEQDAIASQILASLADEDAWKKSFAERRDVIRRMALEALEEDARGETLPLNGLLLNTGREPPSFQTIFSPAC